MLKPLSPNINVSSSPLKRNSPPFKEEISSQSQLNLMNLMSKNQHIGDELKVNG
jgi:hypothetical protein